MQIKGHAGIFTLESSQFLPMNREKAWDFFSSPANLARITPDFMGFKITSPVNEKMYPGQLITYKIGLLPGIKTNWVTEITHVKDLHYFVDEQRFGPYAMWHHEHFFEEVENGVMMRDKVSYKLPFGTFGRLAHFFVQKKLKQIFTYRTQAISTLFSENK